MSINGVINQINLTRYRSMVEQKPLDPITAQFLRLTPSQKVLIGSVIERLLKPVHLVHSFRQTPFDVNFAQIFGEALQLHHTLSDRQLSKENFEYVLIKAMSLSGKTARHGPPGLAGYDIEVNTEKYSLKTQADRSIKRNAIHISKYMELGKGEWIDEKSLAVLRGYPKSGIVVNGR